MTKSDAPTLPAPINGAGKPLLQRLTDIENTLNATLKALPDLIRAATQESGQASSKAISDLQAAQQQASQDAEARQAELLRAVQKIVPPPVEWPDLAGMQKAVQELQETAEQYAQQIKELAEKSASDTVDLAPIEQRLKAVEERKAPEATDFAPIEKRVADLEDRPEPAAPDLQPLESRITALETALGINTPDIPAQAQRQAANAPQMASAATPLDPSMPGYAALLADGTYTSTELVNAATDADLDAVKGIGPITITEIRAYLKGETTNG